jgi:hypothetical protein
LTARSSPSANFESCSREHEPQHPGIAVSGADRLRMRPRQPCQPRVTAAGGGTARPAMTSQNGPSLIMRSVATTCRARWVRPGSLTRTRIRRNGRPRGAGNAVGYRVRCRCVRNQGGVLRVTRRTAPRTARTPSPQRDRSRRQWWEGTGGRTPGVRRATIRACGRPRLRPTRTIHPPT